MLPSRFPCHFTLKQFIQTVCITCVHKTHFWRVLTGCNLCNRTITSQIRYARRSPGYLARKRPDSPGEIRRIRGRIVARFFLSSAGWLRRHKSRLEGTRRRWAAVAHLRIDSKMQSPLHLISSLFSVRLARPRPSAPPRRNPAAVLPASSSLDKGPPPTIGRIRYGKLNFTAFRYSVTSFAPLSICSPWNGVFTAGSTSMDHWTRYREFCTTTHGSLVFLVK